MQRRESPWVRRVRKAFGEPPPTWNERPSVTQVVERPFRDQAFRRHVRAVYGNTCAATGLRLINGGGRPEVEAAHIRPVAAHGTDSVRNGIALTGTVHWLFDRGLIAVADDYRILLARQVPEELARIIRPDRRLALPERREHQPHPSYLAWHRDHVFKGTG